MLNENKLLKILLKIFCIKIAVNKFVHTVAFETKLCYNTSDLNIKFCMEERTVSEIKESRRVKMTKMLLKESLIELMKEKSIHSISIKDVCDGADINRSTFYRHYNTQYELYDDIIQDLMDDMLQIFCNVSTEGYSTTLFLTRLLEYIEGKRDIFLIVLSDKGNISVGETYIRMTAKFLDSENVSETTGYIINFISAGMTSFLWTWLNKEERRSAPEVAAIMSSIIRHGLGRGIEFLPENN